MKLSEQVKEIGEKFLSGEYKQAVQNCGIKPFNRSKCFYRSEDENDNRKCAFGRLITDEEFEKILNESKEDGGDISTVNNIPARILIENHKFLNRFQSFSIQLGSFQSWHDMLFVEIWHEELGESKKLDKETERKNLDLIVAEIIKIELDKN